VVEGERERVSVDQARNIAERLGEVKPTGVKLSGKAFSLESAPIVAEALAALPVGSLSRLDLSDVIASIPTEEALVVLEVFSKAACVHASSIKSLDLSDNALGAKGLLKLSELLKSCELDELFLNNVGLSIDACQILAEILVTESSSCLGLKRLEIWNNYSQSEGAIALARVLSRAPLLEHVRISSTRIGAEGTRALSKALVHCPRLRVLDFYDNGFDIEALETLSQSLGLSEARVESLLMGSTSITAETLESLASSLDLTRLQHLDLSANELVEEEGGKALREFLSKCSVLQILRLDDNDLQSCGLAYMCDVLEKMPLEELSLTGTFLTASSLPALKKIISTCKNTLKKLELNGNNISGVAVGELTEFLESMGFRDVLGPMDENDEDAEVDEAEADEIEKLMSSLAL